MKRLLGAGLVLGLAACASGPGKKSDPPADTAGTAKAAGHTVRGKSPYPPAQEDLSKRGHYTAGGLYAPHIKDSAPDIDIDVSLIPEPEVVAEARSAYGNRPTYAVLGKNYQVLNDTRGFVERGTASYYGNKFHGRRTSNMEVYDMYAFTAAHKSLPLPSFARVTNLDNGRSVVVRVNDRGPFHEGRVVDLSYAAAVKLGVHPAGTGRVEVRALQPGEAPPTQYAAAATPPAPAVQTPATRPAATARAPDSSMDSLVAKLPTAVAPVAAPTVVAAAVPVATTGGTEDWRFQMSRDGRAMTADDFDAWMAERHISIVGGRVVRDDAVPGKTPSQATVASAAPGVSPPSAPSSAPPPTAAATAGVIQASEVGDGVVLQVASFTARDNADRALATLRGAGIAAANLHDGMANGRQVWRVRVGPLEAAAANGLASRIAGLGFGTPQRVKE
ncbi:septal ring lytic transglycosylase RlpA family protein [Lysobacter sp. H21R4]|uniref:septal ring lytic transglycosylase RlpA family protein n=1 Tax=Lysobacter sp. H21R4 TaxID=2781021 RepID=UPI0018870D34|nr:septal ring lytic transglycosylase RlpA family protein [Lysobacter sp. H21R4]QOY62550.1 septal ring lytic transglycosylase RlpA family protein [Lysobacter sp. H21R4]